MTKNAECKIIKIQFFFSSFLLLLVALGVKSSKNSSDIIPNYQSIKFPMSAMARLARVVVPGIPHHITQRGNRKMETFFGEADYREYLHLMAQGKTGV